LFAQGVRAQQAHRLTEAMRAYRAATLQDPSLFEAHYNLGLVATEAGNLSLALASYENALAIQPRSLDARYNFALVLKEANCLTDAVNELEKVLASYPNETRAHLALGNLYAQQFGQPAKARQHYLKVLELDPRHPQASPIRFWMAANPP
jgi:tetratricopeptide (TPR) repeat protein